MPVLTFEGAGLTVGDRTVLAPTTLEITERRVGVIGANGSGKSTLARMVNGLAEPTVGRVLLDGVDVARHGAAVRRRVGFCFTDPSAQLVMPTCVEDVELSLRRRSGDARRRRSRALEVLDRFGLRAQADQSVHSLSGGQRQLLALAGVLAIEPDLVVADEPTTLLDLANTRNACDALFSLDQQLLLVTHDLDQAAGCERVLVVADGSVCFDGDPAAAIAHYRDLVGA